jgi:hypothetical protein
MRLPLNARDDAHQIGDTHGISWLWLGVDRLGADTGSPDLAGCVKLFKAEIVEMGAMKIYALYLMERCVVCADKHTWFAFPDQLPGIGNTVLPIAGWSYWRVTCDGPGHGMRAWHVSCA